MFRHVVTGIVAILLLSATAQAKEKQKREPGKPVRTQQKAAQCPTTGRSATLIRPFTKMGQHFFIALMPTELSEMADTSEKVDRSPVILCEDNARLGPPHSLHADIDTLGRGRFSHYGGGIHFAPSDNSDANTNKRTYRVFVP